MNQQPARPIAVAFATEDGTKFTSTHFGSAKLFSVYHTDGRAFEHVTDFPNTSKEETRHADAEKARSVLDLLADYDVQVVVAPRFGPNIVRFTRLLVPVVVNVDTVQEAWRLLLDNWDQVEALLAASPDTRGHLSLEPETGTSQRHLIIDLERCVACGACVEVCPVDALTIEDSGAQVDNALCVRCGTCVPVCPVEALALA